jgi:hypothetical protein
MDPVTMHTNKTSQKTIIEYVQEFFREFFKEPLTRYAVVISAAIFFFILLEAWYPVLVRWLAKNEFYLLQNIAPVFVTDGDRAFSQGFLEWFGAFYGFFLPLLLVRAWEQLDKADREFDREADAIKVLLEDIMLLDNQSFLVLKITMITMLKKYVQHVKANYETEHLNPNGDPKKLGDSILQGIRANYKDLIYRGGGHRASQLEPVTTELLERLNDAIDVRGDRIAVFRQRLFQSLRTIALITSVIWLVPFYFLDFQSGIFGSLLKLAVTFLIIFVLAIISDLDDPFSGTWSVNTSVWDEVLLETNLSLDGLKENISKSEQKKIAPTSQSASTNFLLLSPLLYAGGIVAAYLFYISPKRGS